MAILENRSLRRLMMNSIAKQWLAAALVTAALLGAAPGAALAADVNWAVDPPIDFGVMLWSNGANWDTTVVPVDGQSVDIDFKTNWNRLKLDVEGGVSLPNSAIDFNTRKTHLFSSAGTPGTLTAKSIKASMGGGYDVHFESPVVVETFTSQASYIEGGITADLLNVTLRCRIQASSLTNVLGEITVNANSNSGWFVEVNAPLTLRAGGSGNTTVTQGQYRANVDGALLPGVVNLNVPTDANAKSGGSSLSMVAQTTMPAMINANGIGTGVVIDDASGLVYTGGTQNIALAPDSAFRDQSDGQVSTGGSGPKAADLPGLIYWAMDSTSNGNRATNVYTLTTNSLDPTSPYKGFAFGTFSSNNANEQKITLKMADGDTGNMQIVTAMSVNNYSRFNDDTTLIHAPGGSTTADILCVQGIANLGGFINGQAIAAGTPDLIDTFRFIANKPGMRLVHKTNSDIIHASQEVQLDNGYMTYSRGGTSIQGTLRLMAGGVLVWDGTNQLTGGGTFIIEDGGFLQIQNQEVVDNLAVAQIQTPGSAGGLILKDTSYDSDAASPTLLDVISRTNIVGADESTYAGTTGLVIAAGKHFAGTRAGDTDIRGGALASAAGTDLHLISPGTRQVRFHAALVDAGTNDIVVGTDPGVEVYTMERANMSQNSSSTDGEVIKQRPTGTVDFNATTTVFAGGLNIKSGTVRQFLDLSLGRLTLGADGTLDVRNSGEAFTVTGTLSGSGKWQGNGTVIVANGATIAPGASVGTLSGDDLTLADGATYDVGIGDASNDLIDISGYLQLTGAWTLNVVDESAGIDPTGLSFAIINYGTIDTLAGVVFASDDFDVTGAGLVAGAGVVTLSGLLPGTPTIPGDANENGFVDDDDLAVLLSNWESDPGTITTWELGDFTADTDVDDDDLAVLLGNWTGPAPGGAAVPEPATLALLGLGGLSVLRRRRP